MHTIHTILEQYRNISKDQLQKGKLFERMIAKYLLTDPKYANELANVWMWNEWPDRPEDWPKDNTGIDLVAQEKDTGKYWAIQCKFYAPGTTLRREHIDSFLADSSKEFMVDGRKHTFAYRLIVSTTDHWGSKAKDAIQDQKVPVGTLYLNELADSPVDWSAFRIDTPQDMVLRQKKTPRDHQNEAIDAVLAGFKTHDRGKLIMACGTGKTYTALCLAEKEELVPPTGRILFLAPSIYLVSQTLREWTAEASKPFHAFVVCSDTTVGKEDEDINTQDLAYPATTNAEDLAEALKQVSADRRVVVFSTYQSIQAVIEAQRIGKLGAFDLVVCDEAHRTTGLTLQGQNPSDFTKVHDNDLLPATKRLYMTATPRIYNDATKTKAGKEQAALYSMDDEAVYGPDFYRLTFGEAVARGLLSEYKVLIVAVDELRVAELTNTYNDNAHKTVYKLDDEKAIDVTYATKIIGSWRGLSKQGLKSIDEDGNEQEITDDTAPMHRAVAFSNSRTASKQITEVFSELVEIYQAASGAKQDGMVVCTMQHVDGTMNAAIRKEALDWLKDETGERECRILSNARCLSEGVDVPALDAVVFFDTRDSIVDIVQAVGRVMRKAPGKEYGYIILPVAIPMSKIKDYNSYVESDAQFKGIWKVLKALRAHDERLVDETEFRCKVNIIGERRGKGDGKPGEQPLLDLPVLPIKDIEQAVYAAIPKKMGDQEYWSEWAKDVARIAEKVQSRIRDLLSKPEAQQAFNTYLEGLHNSINPSITEDEAIDMLVQHVITRPVFDALFGDDAFSRNNPISQAMEQIIDVLDKHQVDSEIESLEKFYDDVRERVSLAKSDKARQDVIRNLYDTFFSSAFPKMADRLGIVYTPVEIVDFMLRSVDQILRQEFGSHLGASDVHILDPFTGTGTFITRLLALVERGDLEQCYRSLLHANEIVLLAYYVAAVNIEQTYHSLRGPGPYEPFPGIVLTDTFQLGEDQGDLPEFLRPNSERARQQQALPITVVLGNPPYSVGQRSENDNNKNLNYPKLDEKIERTYAARSSAKLKRNVYDSYIRAFRWATDRIGERGVVCFVTNGAFIDSASADGFRKTLAEDFSAIYCLNLRGGIRGRSGDRARQEGGNPFGIMTPVAITLLVKNPDHRGPARLHYYDIGDYLSREDKLAKLREFHDVDGVHWQEIVPNDAGDWINQRSELFETFTPLGDKRDAGDDAVFSTFSLGVVTGRDAWAYNFSRTALLENMEKTINNYNAERERFQAAVRAGTVRTSDAAVNRFVDTDPTKVSWTRGLKSDLRKNKPAVLVAERAVHSMYRPFCKQWLYFDRQWNEMVYRIPSLFPTPAHENRVIAVSGVGAGAGYSVLISDVVPCLHLAGAGNPVQCFPRYSYTEASGAANALLDADDMTGGITYERHDAISPRTLERYRARYGDDVTADDVFHYVYGLLHAPDYASRFASELGKMIPRIPMVEDFSAFVNAGAELAKWHLGYESVEPWPLKGLPDQGADPKTLRVEKMRFASKEDRSVIVVNDYVTLSGIPEEAHRYQVNGRSALEWILDRYQVRVDKASGIRNDPNTWSEDPRYIVDLVARIVRVSLESVAIIENLPPLGL